MNNKDYEYKEFSTPMEDNLRDCMAQHETEQYHRRLELELEARLELRAGPPPGKIEPVSAEDDAWDIPTGWIAYCRVNIPALYAIYVKRFGLEEGNDG